MKRHSALLIPIFSAALALFAPATAGARDRDDRERHERHEYEERMERARRNAARSRAYGYYTQPGYGYSTPYGYYGQPGYGYYGPSYGYYGNGSYGRTPYRRDRDGWYRDRDRDRR
jgi:hypothetical protein